MGASVYRRSVSVSPSTENDDTRSRKLIPRSERPSPCSITAPRTSVTVMLPMETLSSRTGAPKAVPLAVLKRCEYLSSSGRSPARSASSR